MVFYGSFETHGILQRFLNPWYLTEVLKDFWQRNTLPRNDLTKKTATFGK